MDFVETEHSIFFYGQRDPRYGFLSNFHPCRFTDEFGNTFFSSEQYFMKKKQETFDPTNKQIAIAILKAKSPPVVKKLGRQVKNYDDDVWTTKRYDFMVEALKLKFSADEELKERLLATGEKMLYEASRSDAIWGIGLGVAHIAQMFQENKRFRTTGEVDATIQEECFGQNLLGKALVETRMWLAAQGE